MGKPFKAKPKLSRPTLQRLTEYLMILEQRVEEGGQTVSSSELAEAYSNTPSQVRQDIFNLHYEGRAGRGYKAPELAAAIRRTLGMDVETRLAIIGCGKFGSALAEHVPFESYGMRLSALYDIDPGMIGSKIRGVTVEDASALERSLRRRGIELAGLCVPAEAAQDTALKLASAGVKGILNFTRKRLKVPSGVAVRHMQMVCSFMQLAFEVKGR